MEKSCQCGECVSCLRETISLKNNEIINLRNEIIRLNNLMKYIPKRKK